MANTPKVAGFLGMWGVSLLLVSSIPSVWRWTDGAAKSAIATSEAKAATGSPSAFRWGTSKWDLKP